MQPTFGLAGKLLNFVIRLDPPVGKRYKGSQPLAKLATGANKWQKRGFKGSFLLSQSAY